MNSKDMVIGNNYKFIGQDDELLYVGFNLSGNGYWHQFEKTDNYGVVWSELQGSDLNLIEEVKPNMTTVTSSNIKAVGHKDGVLYVEFKGGKTFSYEDVSENQYNEFIKSNSVGSFFARNIKNNHEASEVK